MCTFYLAQYLISAIFGVAIAVTSLPSILFSLPIISLYNIICSLTLKFYYDFLSNASIDSDKKE
jgi:hypothetical protein